MAERSPGWVERSPGMVTFLTDFGWAGGYVAACEATMLRIAPDLRVLHVSHEVPNGDVASAALVLARVAPLGPQAVHLAVVDPGVGTSRRPLALATARGDVLVGPDNGLLLPAADALGGAVAAWALDIGAVRRKAALPPAEVSNTFHGRDVFSPAAALLATGSDPSALGTVLDPASLVRPPVPSSRRSRAGSGADRDYSGGAANGDATGETAVVIEVDRFGNVGLDRSFAELRVPEGSAPSFLVEIMGEGAPEWIARIVRTYGDLAPGELGLIRDSWGQAALTLNGASAAELLGLKIGAAVTLTPESEEADGR
jgi:S-adenosyl-L-methionine hydrolase (adenosine-forming)